MYYCRHHRYSWTHRIQFGSAVTPTLLAFAVVGLATRLCVADQLLVCSSGNNTVQRFDLDTNEATGTVASGGGLSYPWGAARGSDGNLYVSGFGSHAVLRYDGETGAFIDHFVPPHSGGLLGPGDLVFGDDGMLYVSSMYSGEVLRYDAQTGAFAGVFIGDESGGLNSPRGLEFGPGGDLFVVNHYAGEVLRFDGQSGAFEGVFASFGFGDFDGDLVFGPDGSLYVTMYQDDAVAKYDGQSGEFISWFVPPFNNWLDGPMGIAFGNDGTAYVANYLWSVTMHDGKTGEFLGSLSSINVSNPSMIVIVDDDPVVGDVDGSGAVDIDDLVMVILTWGPCASPPQPCAADLDHSGAVNVDDLVMVIVNWG
jgi:DNA-binding beta-propeller fold protein YncE